MTMINLNPWREMRTLREAMDELLEESMVRPSQRRIGHRQTSSGGSICSSSWASGWRSASPDG